MTTTTESSQSPTTEAFADRVFGAVVETATSASIYTGEKLGLYRALADHGPLTRDELSRHAPIHWRYAQEWLEQQSVLGILAVEDPDADASRRRYSLPTAHAEVLLDENSLYYLAPLVRLLMAGTTSIHALLEAYRTGGGVSWPDMGEDARTGQADMNRPFYLRSLGEEWFPAIPELHDLLRAGGRVADIACGEGWSSIGIARAYPDAQVDGYDVDGPSIEAARRHAAEAGVSDRVRFHQVDAAELTLDGVYEAVVGFEFLHDLPHPTDVLEAMRRIARPGAPVVVMDERVPERFTGRPDPVEQLMYAFSMLICLPDGMAHQPSAATGTVIRPGTLRSYALKAGFSEVEVLPIENDLWRFYRLVEEDSGGGSRVTRA